MQNLTRYALAFAWLASSLCVVAQTTVQKVSVLDSGKDAGDELQLQIATSQPVTPEAQIIVNPFRLVIDFPNSSPGAELRNLTVNRGDVKNIRVGLFGKNPPVTRVVVDLKAPVVYQVSTSGQNVVLKLSSATRATAMPEKVVVAAAAAVPQAPPPPRAEVHFKRGMMSIHSDKASLAEVLGDVRRATGAEIQIPPGAAQEQVFFDLGPAPAREVMAALLNGSGFNFVVVGSDDDPNALRSVILTSKNGGGVSMPIDTSSQQVDAIPPQQFNNNMAPDSSRQDMRNMPPDGNVPAEVPVGDQEDPGDTPPPSM
jgi:AMIN domain